ncbi:MAG: hypothetical protein CENE_00868 [Candidatus Celerinatantimonas neptuna]|nr:MAG: hypothetical protein CENE_00868 [Candidatus Celerinatantimonas neptuna]
MTELLWLISNATPLVELMDQACLHQTYLEKPFPNIKIILIPSYSPELNPIEQVWSWLRQHRLANRSFENDDDIFHSVERAWNPLGKMLIGSCRSASRNG